MPPISDTFFQMSFSYPEDQTIKDYTILKIFETGTTSWSYWDDIIEFSNRPTLIPSEKKTNNKISEQKGTYLLTREFQKVRKGSLSFYKKKADLKKHLRKEGNIIYLNPLSFKNLDVSLDIGRADLN